MSSTSMSTGITNASNFRVLRRRRRLSTPPARQCTRLQICRPLPLSLEALDLSTASPIQTLASLRFLVLSYLADLESRLSKLESPDIEAWIAKGELKLEEARAWARVAIQMLDCIRTDVCSHLPAFNFGDLDISVENFVRDMPARLLSDIPLPNVRSHLPDFDFEFGSSLSDMRNKLDGVRTRFYDLDFDFDFNQNYIPTLSKHLQNLHSHLSSMELPGTSFDPSSMLSDLVDVLLSSELVSDFLLSGRPESSDNKDDVSQAEDVIERAAKEVSSAIQRSFHGVRLIQYTDLPQKWRNNPFVTRGYRFIPIERWPLILLSLFAFHNETLNIHTHLIPFLLWGVKLLRSVPVPLISFFTPLLPTPGSPDLLTPDTTELVFTLFSLLCLLFSAVYHTMAGCAHRPSMEFCARVDYVGIGWLISASVGTVVHYGYRECHPSVGNIFLVSCFLTGLAGNIFPFMDWFNRYEYRIWRIVFFLSLAFSAVAPLAGLAMLHSSAQLFTFIGPLLPSLASYIIGLVFYATHVPERFLPPAWCRKLDMIGGGSHCIWHCFIVLAVSQHKAAIRFMREGIAGGC